MMKLLRHFLWTRRPENQENSLGLRIEVIWLAIQIIAAGIVLVDVLIKVRNAITGEYINIAQLAHSIGIIEGVAVLLLFLWGCFCLSSLFWGNTDGCSRCQKRLSGGTVCSKIVLVASF